MRNFADAILPSIQENLTTVSFNRKRGLKVEGDTPLKIIQPEESNLSETY